MRHVPEAWWRAAAQKVPHPLAAVGSNNRFLWVNDAFCRLLGYAPAEIEAMRWNEITAPEDVGGDLEAIQEIMDGKRDEYYLEKTYIRKGGEHVVVSLFVHRFPEYGEVTSFIVAAKERDSGAGQIDDLRRDMDKFQSELDRLRNPWPYRWKWCRDNWAIISGVAAGLFALISWVVSFFVK